MGTSLDQVNEPPAWVRDWLSPARLGRYVAAAGAARALEFYAWNCRTSTALFELIGWFEVAWRNNINRAICDRRDPGAHHWLLDKAFPLQPKTRIKITEAMRKLHAPKPTPDQVIAELTLGFWRFTAGGYRQTLWLNYLSHGFPHAPARPQPAVMDRQLDAIIKLRNRIAHHEPIHVVDVRRIVEDMLTIGHWISPDMAAWWRDKTDVWRMLALRPC